MANYDSTHTGAQIDNAVNIALGLSHTPIQIDGAVDVVDALTTTPAEIDNAVEYINDLETASVSAGDITIACGFVGQITNSPEDIDATIDKFETVNSQPAQIDETVDLLVNNNASIFNILLADGAGKCSWQTLASMFPVPYQNFDTLTKTTGAVEERIEIVYWRPTPAHTFTSLQMYIKGLHNSINSVLPAVGHISNGGVDFPVEGIYYTSYDGQYHAINNVGLTLNDITFDLESFTHNIRQVPTWTWS